MKKMKLGFAGVLVFGGLFFSVRPSMAAHCSAKINPKTIERGVAAGKKRLAHVRILEAKYLKGGGLSTHSHVAESNLNEALRYMNYSAKLSNEDSVQGNLCIGWHYVRDANDYLNQALYDVNTQKAKNNQN